MKITNIGFLLVVVALTSGCASILNDKTQTVNVSASNGEAISGTVNGMPFKAPGMVVMTRENSNKVFVVDTPGCVKETAANKSVDIAFLGNIISGGTFGSSTDYETEKMWKYADNIVINCNTPSVQK
jgi:uncharacterized protein YceK